MTDTQSHRSGAGLPAPYRCAPGSSENTRRRGPLPKLGLAGGLIALAVLLLVVVLLSLAIGNKYVPLPDVISALFTPGDSYADVVVASHLRIAHAASVRHPRSAAGLPDHRQRGRA